MWELLHALGLEHAGCRKWVVALVEWVWVLGIVGVSVKGCVHGSSAKGRIPTGMVAYQARSLGRWNLTPLGSQCVALVHPETGQHQLLAIVTVTTTACLT